MIVLYNMRIDYTRLTNKSARGERRVTNKDANLFFLFFSLFFFVVKQLHESKFRSTLHEKLQWIHFAEEHDLRQQWQSNGNHRR
jgi:hypothetical protein